MPTKRWKATVLFLFLFGLPFCPAPSSVLAQSEGDWWKPVTVERAGSQAAREPPADERGWRRGNRKGPRHSRGRPTVHVPKGHLPPPGTCRLWYPDRPPGHQPPPVSCKEAYAHRRGPAVVVHGGAPRSTSWRQRRAGDLVFRRPPPAGRRGGFRVRIIIDILGRRGIDRLDNWRSHVDAEGPLTGRWVSLGPARGHVLQIRADGRPFAELADRNGDGRVERLLLNEAVGSD